MACLWFFSAEKQWNYSVIESDKLFLHMIRNAKGGFFIFSSQRQTFLKNKYINAEINEGI